MIVYQLFMGFCSLLCIGSACCVAYHIVWMYRRETSPTFKEVLFHWGVMVLPLVALSIFFLYNTL